MLVTPNFHFHGDCEEAMLLYQKAFSGEITCMLRYRDANPEDYSADSRWNDYIYHAEMLLHGFQTAFGVLAHTGRDRRGRHGACGTGAASVLSAAFPGCDNGHEGAGNAGI